MSNNRCLSDDVRRIIDSYIEQSAEQMVEFLCQYIEHPSVNLGEAGSGKEGNAQEWIAQKLKEMRFEVNRVSASGSAHRPNVVARIPKGQSGSFSKSGRSLILNGHTDVVPVSDAQLPEWTVNPWKGTVKDGRVYGRGANDLKGGNTAAIWACKAIKECGIKVDGEVLLQLVCGEESNEAESIGTGFVIDQGYRADFAIVVEPTNCEIAINGPSFLLLKLTVKGKEVHNSSRNLVIFPQPPGVLCGPAVGVDAVDKLIPFLNMFRSLETQWNMRWRPEPLSVEGAVPGQSPGIGPFTINPSIISGGNYLGSIPGSASVTYVVWYPNWIDSSTVKDEIERKVAAVASLDDWLTEHPPQIEYMLEWEGYGIKDTHSGVTALRKAYQIVSGESAKLGSFRAVCDATYLNKRGIPSVVFGPGDLSMGTHGPDEYVPIDQLIRCAKVYANMILEWCTTE